MQSIELILDEHTEAAVRADWATLRDLDVPSLAGHTGASNRPHITLLVAGRFDTAELGPVRQSVAALPVAISLGGIVVFGAGRRGFVLARHVVVTRALATLHRSVHAAAPGRSDGVVELTLPDRWTPHVTLARRLTAPQVSAALTAIGAAALPPATAVGARLWDGVEKTVTPLAP
jgi:2'-5' RNA ligase